MCGIGGLAGGRIDLAELERMAGAMAHRGPDGQDVWAGEHCGLAFRRLAIIDLDERSMQPLHLGPLHLVFNGEIYDYREVREELRGLGHTFVTEGDGEVLVHAWQQWGEGALPRVNGMFAFAVHDERDGSTTLACDAFGEKPLFWTEGEDGQIAFASDLRALAGWAGAAPDEDALAPYLGLGLLPPVQRTFTRGVQRLPGAHVLRIDVGRGGVREVGHGDLGRGGPRDAGHGGGGRASAPRRWWEPGRVSVPPTFAGQADALRELLLDSIALRLRADVPVGTSLSGGVDSGAIVALSATLAGDHRRHAFTATFPGFERDEWDRASAVASAAGVMEHHAVKPTGDDLLADLDALVQAQEEPFASSSIYAQYRVNRAAREAGVTVLLDGQGADELFAGYPVLGGWATRAKGPAAIARAALGGDGAPLRAIGVERAPGAARRRFRRSLATPYASTDVVDAAVRIEPPHVDERDPLRRELLRQSFHTSLPQLLRYADKSSMAWSREVRLPFLDRRIAEFALSLPPEALHRDGVSKRVLRDAVRGIVPDVVLDRRDKVGFETPQARWLSEPAFRARTAEVLLDTGARTSARGLVDRQALEADVAAGRWRDPAGLWRALNLELWLRGRG